MTSTHHPHHLYILTGASRGMGRAMAELLLQPSHTLITIARGPLHLACPQGARFVHWQLDLSEPQAAAQHLEHWLRSQTPQDFASVQLINNAGVIPPIAPLASIEGTDLAHALRVGLEAPMLLCSSLLRATADWALPKKILNISSGLGRRAMASQAAYCAAKAGLDNFSAALALEEARKPHGARVCSLAPGVIATDMQVQMRSARAQDFPDQERFIQLHAQGLLTSAQEAASQVLAWLQRPDFGSPVLADVRQA